MSEPQVVTLAVGDRELNLTQALKRSGCVLSGGEAKSLIAEGRVRVNGELELRKRKQLAVGDVIEMEEGPTIRLV
jgi:ribosome-associated protein